MNKPAINISKWIAVRNAGEKETVLDIDGDIGLSIDWIEWRLDTSNTKEAIKKLLKDVPNSRQHRLTVNINSLGGNANDGFSIHDYLAEHKAQVTTVITGYTASAATIIAQSASEGRRLMSSNAFYLIHRGQMGLWGNANEMQSVVDDLTTFDERLSELYARRSGRPASDFMELMNKNNGNGIWLSADEALQYGLIDEVVEPHSAAKQVHNKTEIFNRLGLPDLPEGEPNPSTMNREELQNMFNSFRDEVRNMVQNITRNASGDEVRVLDNEELQNRITAMENTLAENTVTIDAHNAVVQERDSVIAERDTAQGERDTAQNRVTELEGEVQNLQSEVARLSGTPTPVPGEGDPDPQKGGQGKTKNQIAAEQNAASLRSV